MTYENILLEKQGAIAYVTINRPAKLNALNMDTMEETTANNRLITNRTIKLTTLKLTDFNG